ncbi:glycosyltransferase auxiliary protein/mycaminosyltransferase auxiliary protein tylMIII/glycosyltransferase auxiliary protein DesVIII [Nonomuraea solani]|uniref:Glycosyltransferase auxiliary protein/mycaminosyltransferase auxiliary protein tylMIII/glycosyltransferase auxiliary protein DesVIII n=1 Tax=Nonomuraea solani TaxID=1144553 RepID=A0A1H6F136_9ACTN|nr:P450-derived glycosyltransferase activator [Nonomuraea solani]SEH03868.1 glycosyltransferase auxiliary protein/mycaminosyltransferase auxiliary protein tylMIII/glycosyltransferase auxiliary protein DesVIII [Nonomuraea solani]
MPEGANPVADYELGLRLLNARATQRVLGSLGDPFALVLRGADDPYPLYAAIRERGPIYSSTTGSRVTADPEVIAEVLADPLWRMSSPDGSPVAEQPLPFYGYGTQGAEADEHTRLRAHWQPLVDPEALAAHRKTVERECLARLDRITGDDLMAGYAWPVATAATGALLGVPAAALPRYAECCAAAAALPDSLLAAQPLTLVRRIEDAVAGLDALFGGEPGTPDRAVRVLLSTTAVPATAHLVGNAVHALLAEPGRWAALSRDPGLAEAAVAETLRYDPPVQMEIRVAAAPVELTGTTLPAGSHLVMITAAAGRDAARHPEPDGFRLDRQAEPEPLAFAGGLHHLPVAPLARAQAEVALRILAEARPNLRPSGAPVYRRRAPVVRGPVELPVHGLGET